MKYKKWSAKYIFQKYFFTLLCGRCTFYFYPLSFLVSFVPFFWKQASVPIVTFSNTDKYQYHGWNTKAQYQQLFYNLCVGVILHRDLCTSIIATEGNKLASKHIKNPQKIYSNLKNQDLVVWAALLGLIVNFSLPYCVSGN